MTAPNRQTPPPAFWCPHCEVWSQRTYHFCEKGPSLIPQMDKETRCEQVEVVPASELAEARKLIEAARAAFGNPSPSARVAMVGRLDSWLARSAPTPEAAEARCAALEAEIVNERRAVAALARQLEDAREALSELLRLKDGPRDAAYEKAKPRAWERARRVLGGRE